MPRLIAKPHFIIAAISILVVMMAVPASAYEIDTTMVREKPEQRSSTADAILSVPSFILALPFQILEGVSSLVMNEIIFSDFIQRLFFLEIDRVWGLYPVLGYGSNPGFKLGLTFSSRDVFTKGSRIEAKGYLSTHDYQLYRIEYNAPSDFGIFRNLGLMAEYKQQPWETFYGLGNTSNESDHVSFNLERTMFEVSWSHNIYQGLNLGLNGGYGIYNTFDGEDPDLVGDLDSIQNRFNLSNEEIASSRVWNIGISLEYDWVDQPGQPSFGGYEKISLNYHKGIDRSDDLEYFHGRIDIGQYVNLFKKRIIALRLMAEAVNRPDDTPHLPFYLRPSLGGWENLRGYKDNRFVDYSLTLATLEYRYPVIQNIDGFIFYEQGRVFEAITEQFELEGWQYSVGAGLRLWNIEGALFRGTIAYSKEGFQLYAEFEESF